MDKKILNNTGPNEPVYSIGKVARIVGVSVQMLRLYEYEGLIIPYKKSSLHRLYSQVDIDRLVCIRKMINEEKISIMGIKRIMALIPCWAIKRCPVEVRNSCQAFRDHTKPCWLHKSDSDGCDKNKCRDCLVYKNLVNCSGIKLLLNQVNELVLKG